MLSLVTAAELQYRFDATARDREQQILLSIREHAAAADTRAPSDPAPRAGRDRSRSARPITTAADDLVACPAT